MPLDHYFRSVLNYLTRAFTSHHRTHRTFLELVWFWKTERRFFTILHYRMSSWPPAGRGRKPCSALVCGEPQRTPAHGGDEETWRPPDRVSGDGAIVVMVIVEPKVVESSDYWCKFPTVCFLQEGILHHHGEMGHQHQTGRQLAEQSAEQLDPDAVRGHDRSLH